MSHRFDIPQGSFQLRFVLSVQSQNAIYRYIYIYIYVLCMHNMLHYACTLTQLLQCSLLSKTENTKCFTIGNPSATRL